MSLIAQEPRRFSNLVKQELFPEHGYCRAVVTLAAAAELGTALGQVTETGAWVVANAGATDGSQNVAALVLEKVAADKALVLVSGPAIVSDFGIKLDASFDTPAEKAAAYAALEAKGIKVYAAV